MVYAVVLLAIGLSLFIQKTRFGLRLRAVGEDADAARVNIVLYQTVTVEADCQLQSCLPLDVVPVV